MRKEKQYIKLAKDHLGKDAKNYNQVQLAIIGEDQHKQRQSKIDQLFKITRL